MAVSKLDALGFPSPLGNPGASSTNLVLGGSSTLRVTGESFTDRGMTLNSGTNTIDVYNAADQVTIAGQIIGSGALQKLGLGTLALTASNSYSGGTLIRAGSLSLGGGDANQYALGPGLVTLDNGTLSMFSDSGSYDKVYWNVFVPSGATGTLNADARVDWYGSLTGGGTLNFYVPYVRTTLYGNWSPFTGRINVSTDADGGDFRVSNSYGYANATIYLGNLVVAYHVTSGTTVSVGELSGTSSAKLSGAAWAVGAKSTDATFAGNIAGNSITKVGTWHLDPDRLKLLHRHYHRQRRAIAGQRQRCRRHRCPDCQLGGTLGGTGVIGGPTTVNGTLSPGASAGTLTFNGNVTLAGTSTTLIEIGKSPLTNDLLRVLGTLDCGGALVVTNISGVLEAGDSFQVLDAAALTGAFGTLSLAACQNRPGVEHLRALQRRHPQRHYHQSPAWPRPTSSGKATAPPTRGTWPRPPTGSTVLMPAPSTRATRCSLTTAGRTTSPSAWAAHCNLPC